VTKLWQRPSRAGAFLHRAWPRQRHEGRACPRGPLDQPVDKASASGWRLIGTERAVELVKGLEAVERLLGSFRRAPAGSGRRSKAGQEALGEAQSPGRGPGESLRSRKRPSESMRPRERPGSSFGSRERLGPSRRAGRVAGDYDHAVTSRTLCGTAGPLRLPPGGVIDDGLHAAFVQARNETPWRGCWKLQWVLRLLP
jgi:hypothetical protein